MCIRDSYGAHVFFLSRLGRLEDDEDDAPLANRPSEALRGVAITAVLLPIAAWWAVRGTTAGPGPLSVGLIVALLIGVRTALRTNEAARQGAVGGWTRADVGRAMGGCLRRLPFVSASMAAPTFLLGPLGLVALLFAFLGGALSGALRRLFPLT